MTRLTQTLPAATGSTEITRFNALRHGILSRYTVLPWEDAEEYRTIVAALVAEHAPRSLRSTVSARGPLTYIFSPASATPMPGRPAISPCRKRPALPSACRPGHPRRRCKLWRKHGGRGGPWPRACCGPTIARSKGGKARPSSRLRVREARMAVELDGPRLAPAGLSAKRLPPKTSTVRPRTAKRDFSQRQVPSG